MFDFYLPLQQGVLPTPQSQNDIFLDPPSYPPPKYNDVISEPPNYPPPPKK